jgi:adenylate cyclase
VTNSEENEPSDKPAPLLDKARSDRNFGAGFGHACSLSAACLPRLPPSVRWPALSLVIGMPGRRSAPTFLQEGQKTQSEATARAAIVPRLSLVVLPFANLNNNPEQDYFADGIATDLTTDIGQMPGAFVIGRGTAFTYKNKQVDLNITVAIYGFF